ncbi:hypothetical protein K2Z84_17400 [Candidatus Binatia bacterium]|jgi:hypothetical protein|nr:hypothetical protein [Candidatus Binatia bacterium]
MSDDGSSEAQSILDLCEGDRLKAFQMVQGQLGTLVMRLQAILGLSSIVITVTGFSGRTVAQTSTLAKVTVVAGLVLVLIAAAVGMGGVLRLRWSTQELGGSPLESIARVIRIRDHKERFMTTALVLFVVGFAMYCFAVAQLLMAP